MTVGSKVVCIDDKFPLGIEKFYVALPKAGVVYVIREMTVGISLQGEEGEVCVLLVGLNNPRSSKAPFPERGFKAERFRPLDEIKEETTEQTVVEAPARSRTSTFAKWTAFTAAAVVAAGFATSTAKVRARPNGKGAQHTIWLAESR